MQNNQPVTPTVVDEDNIKHLSKRKKRGTVCKDKRKDSHHCGICGSANLAYQGVIFCTECEAEKEFLETGHVYGFHFSSKLEDEYNVCDCKRQRGNYTYRFLRTIQTVECLDCGSSGSTKTCPICAGQKYGHFSMGNCWTDKSGNKRCQRCGFRTT